MKNPAGFGSLRDYFTDRCQSIFRTGSKHVLPIPCTTNYKNDNNIIKTLLRREFTTRRDCRVDYTSEGKRFD